MNTIDALMVTAAVLSMVGALTALIWSLDRVRRVNRLLDVHEATIRRLNNRT